MPLGISAGTAALIGAGVTGAASLGAAAIQSGNVGKAGQQSAFNRLLATQQAQNTFNTSTGQIQDAVKQGQGYVAPYYAAGTPAIGQEGALLGLQGQDAANAAMSTFQNSPGYQWQMQQGLRGVDAGAAAGVRLPGVRSGATVKAEETFAENLANTSFGDYWNRLNSLAGMGQNAATSEANLGTWGAGQLANVGANLNNWPDVLNNPDWISQYKNNALPLATTALQQGDWAVVGLLASANSGTIRNNNMLNQVTGTNIQQAYTYAKLMSLGQPTGTNPSARSNNALSTLGSQLSADQIQAADAQAQSMYQQYFNATPRQTGEIANTMRSCQAGF